MAYTCSLVHVADVPDRRALRSSGSNGLQIPPFKLSTVGGRAFPVAAARFWNRLPDNHVGQFVVGFSAATETHSVPAVIPRHYPVTFLNCNTHSGPSSGIAT